MSFSNNNSYIVGKIRKYSIVITILPDGEYGIASVANIARDILYSFPNIRIGLIVGISGGALMSGLKAYYKIKGHRLKEAINNDKVSYAVVCSNNLLNLILQPKRTESKDNLLIKDALIWDILTKEKDVLCFEMEVVGLMNHFLCLVIRGIYNYSDSYKNKEWQGYVVIVAAIYAKDLLY
ncbi:hypothetical protein V2W45_1466039 [Cenococcum geophilum]